MQLMVDKVKDVAVVTVNTEDFDASSSEEFKRQIAPVLQTTNKLILDLQRVGFVDSSGCGAILSCLKALTTSGGDLKICRVSGPVRSTFELVRMHRICQVCATREEALQAFGVTP